ncbi:serine/threonine-protein kinase [Tuwongella immobilis]|uniref:Protein kinase domain-containing protein n=1 Tax=Tuwongella immobilis TaxID=692036 RepID=A0A6C2YXM0_9BACT|nr:serine/threonine-protein kinase [Tuwongella immobilis]VIP05552.1 wd40 repeat-containing protein : Uncultured bacterium genome assembly Metasoil_fosmids_resub OS=uncultured bacterium PE=4 SV=1: Pkinase: WD40: WD40: WD40: PQQ_2 [Tuwongella immobilis]VTS08460.1 wd40 repeat-containing protein : Uncultured bacterium genome assembly Metasoil_fosmids_resub OS=uncultured bacterium PE=4 SV=1: Pkinase: WD40: WD40: WD40: PQQ_2 [Tuwongella immobilis]
MVDESKGMHASDAPDADAPRGWDAHARPHQAAEPNSAPSRGDPSSSAPSSGDPVSADLPNSAPLNSVPPSSAPPSTNLPNSNEFHASGALTAGPGDTDLQPPFQTPNTWQLNPLQSNPLAMDAGNAACQFPPEAIATTPLPITPIRVPRVDSDRPSWLPQTIGRFPILRLIGEGGFGTVYLAKDLTLNRDVAVKVPRLDRGWNPQYRNRLMSEAEAAGRLDHPALVPIYAVEMLDADVPILISQYVPGITLHDWIQQHRRAGKFPPWVEVLACLAEIADGLAHAHDRGVIHCDLKPSNILLELGDPRKPRLTDFGLARLQRECPSQQTQTVENKQLLGTPPYMSPEQARNRRLVTRPSDLYALGVVLFESLCGRTPWTEDELLDEPWRLQEETAPSIAKYRPDTPKNLQLVVSHCLAKSPQARYGDAAILAADLRNVQRGEPISFQSPSLWQHWQRWCRRHPMQATGILTAMLVLMGGVLAIAWQNSMLQIRNQRIEDLLAKSEADGTALKQHQRVLRQQNYSLVMRDIRELPDSGRRAELLRGLKQLIPVDGEVDLRGFEWFYLRHLAQAPQRVLTGHRGDVYGVHFSPDGKLLLSRGKDGTLRFWDPERGVPLREPLIAHRAEVNDIAWTEDGRQFATCSDAGEVRLWDRETGQLLAECAVPDSMVYSVAFLVDSEQIVFADNRTRIRHWNRKTGTVSEVSTDANSISVVRYAREAANIQNVFVLADDARIQRYRLTWNHATQRLHAERQEVWNDDKQRNLTPLNSPNRVITSGPGPGPLWLHDFASKQRIALAEYLRIGNWDSHLLAPDQVSMYIGNRNGTIRRLTLDTMASTAMWNVVDGRIWSLAIDPNSRYLAVACSNGTVQLWDPQRLVDADAIWPNRPYRPTIDWGGILGSGIEPVRHLLPKRPAEIPRVQTVPGQSSMLVQVRERYTKSERDSGDVDPDSTSNHRLQLWDIHPPRLRNWIDLPPEIVQDAEKPHWAVLPRGNGLVQVESESGRLLFRSLPDFAVTDEVATRFPASQYGLRTGPIVVSDSVVSWMPVGRPEAMIAVGTDRGWVECWTVSDSGQWQSRMIAVPEGQPQQLAFSGSALMMVNGTDRVWKLDRRADQWQEFATIRSEAGLSMICVHQNRVIVAGEGSDLVTFDAETGELLWQMVEVNRRVRGVTVSPQGDRVMVATSVRPPDEARNGITIRDLTTGEEIFRLGDFSLSDTRGVAIDHTGEWLLQWGLYRTQPAVMRHHAPRTRESNDDENYDVLP